MASLSGKSVIITGASRGIGAATARVMAEAGANLMLLARSEDALTELAGELTANGARAEARACDIADYAQLEAAVARTRAIWGGVDVMVNNAAVIEPIGALHNSDPAAWTRAADINFNGIYFGIRAVLPAMRAQRSGVIINVSSGAAHEPLEGWSHYCASKAGAFMLTRCAYLENRGAGIRVMSLSPGTVATDMQRRIKASGINPVSRMDFSEHIPPDVPARALTWLATDDAADLAGQEVSLRDPEIRARIGLN
jgi:NAD(P)-dependent dehydrogenase (short-subunit alcohol dehydrogenase family)